MRACMSVTSSLGCTSALSSLLVKSLVLSLASSQYQPKNTMHSQAPYHNTGSHAFQVHSMRINSLQYCTQTSQAYAAHGSPDSVMAQPQRELSSTLDAIFISYFIAYPKPLHHTPSIKCIRAHNGTEKEDVPFCILCAPEEYRYIRHLSLSSLPRIFGYSAVWSALHVYTWHDHQTKILQSYCSYSTILLQQLATVRM